MSDKADDGRISALMMLPPVSRLAHTLAQGPSCGYVALVNIALPHGMQVQV